MFDRGESVEAICQASGIKKLGLLSPIQSRLLIFVPFVGDLALSRSDEEDDETEAYEFD